MLSNWWKVLIFMWDKILRIVISISTNMVLEEKKATLLHVIDKDFVYIFSDFFLMI